MKTVSFFKQSYRVTSNFAAHINSGRPGGIDYATPMRTKIYAPEAGWLQTATDKFGGKYVMLTSSSGLWLFVHLDQFNGGNKQVRKGALIGWSGNTGNSTGPHTHVEFRIGGKQVDPNKHFKIISMSDPTIAILRKEKAANYAKYEAQKKRADGLEREVKTTYESYLKEKEFKDGYKQDVERLMADNEVLKIQLSECTTKEACPPCEEDKGSFIVLFIKKIYEKFKRKDI
jgi:murein DD-endopeptidase MepM/ murein hydrolase activator NlpD